MQRSLDEILSDLKTRGWTEVFAAHGWDLSPDTAHNPLQTIKRELAGFEDFAPDATRPIEPGDPPRSLLYHALCSPAVRPEGAEHVPLDVLDAVENIIYGAAKRTDGDLEGTHLVVLAYEYRTASQTPHGCHADLVFSRTGVGRVGNAPHRWSPERRCFASGSGADTRVQAVRYGLFFCRPAQGPQGLALAGGLQPSDDKRRFWVPVHKAFAGSECIEGRSLSLVFEHRHVDEKLARMVTVGGLELRSGIDASKPPLRYDTDDEGSDFVRLQAHHGSVVVARKPQALAREAKQGGKLVSVEVPRARPEYCGFSGNRRYSTMRVGQSLPRMAIDHAARWFAKTVLRRNHAYLSPRNCAEFTNVRLRRSDGEQTDDLNTLDGDAFAALLDAGGYHAVLFEDGTADGVVVATVKGLDHPHPVEPAFSLMTAPDFMPRVTGPDIDGFEDMFKQGGPRSLSEGRLRPNPRLCLPNSGAPAFRDEDTTIVAVFSQARQGSKATSAETGQQTRTLPDAASDVFAPGWDITYGREGLFSPPYYHTAGLGSPYLEDVKLCAAANGMWPAASPDAARTFQRIATPTAIPLTDVEVGLHPRCALVDEGAHASSAGWDGEFGPYVVVEGDRVAVDFAEIGRSDYVRNGLDGEIRFDPLRALSPTEVRQRMLALQQARARLPDDVWLVSFMPVERWDQLAGQLNLPAATPFRRTVLDTFAEDTKPGYVLLFAEAKQWRENLTRAPRSTAVAEALHAVRIATETTVVSWPPS